jgi:hypothetical protein
LKHVETEKVWVHCNPDIPLVCPIAFEESPQTYFLPHQFQVSNIFHMFQHLPTYSTNNVTWFSMKNGHPRNIDLVGGIPTPLKDDGVRQLG